MAKQMQALDGFVMRARSQNGRHHDGHLESLGNLATNTSQSYSNVHDHFEAHGDRICQFKAEASDNSEDLQKSVLPLTEDVRQPLLDLQSSIEQAALTEYTATGKTPEKTQYDYPTSLPQTQKHETLLAKIRRLDDEAADSVVADKQTIDSPAISPSASPTKTMVYNDADDEVGSPRPLTTEVLKPTPSIMGLREVDLNIVAARQPVSNSSLASSELSPVPLSASTIAKDIEPSDDVVKPINDMAPPPTKKQRSVSTTTSGAGFTESKLPQKMSTRKTVMMEGRENVPLSMQTRSRGNGRKLRSSPT